MCSSCLVAAVALVVLSGVPGMFFGRRSPVGEVVAAAMMVGGSTLGLGVAVSGLTGRVTAGFGLRGPLGEMSLGYHLDALSAFFLVPIFLIGACGSIYGLGYWKQEEHPRTGRRVRLFYGLLIGALALVVIAGDAIAFLFAWEVMALSAFALVSTEERKKSVREAGWLYLVSTHVCTLVLFAMFALLRVAAKSFELRQLEASEAGPGLRGVIFLLALVGFGFKAGMMPFHFWLPSAHASAPSHVSAILSGVMLKVGIYGLLRTLMILSTPAVVWGWAVLALGTISAVGGVLFALGQHDLKRLLAYHSIENIGIILMGLGVAMIGQALGRVEWVVLGLAGCLLHVWNHALFKSLLFLAAGSVVRATRTHEIDRMGGLGKVMPGTAMLFFIGAVAICGLPPLNGFVSELLIYLGLLGSLDRSPGIALGAPALGLVGALAVACFVKAFGAVFLGSGRSRAAEEASESPSSMKVPMGVLALCCVGIGVAPVLAGRPLATVIGQWNVLRGGWSGEIVPLGTLTWVTVPLAGIIGVIFLVVLRGWVNWGARVAVTWDCGYVRPSSRMQYSASSFAGMLVGLFRGVLRPHVHKPKVVGVFPSAARFESHVDDVVLDGLLTPVWRRFQLKLRALRMLQQGSVQAYIFYILLILTLLLVLTIPLRDVLRVLTGGEAP
jgi:hydrogenase-4 component B